MSTRVLLAQAVSEDDLQKLKDKIVPIWKGSGNLDVSEATPEPYEFVEEATLPAEVIEKGVTITVDNGAHSDYTTMAVSVPKKPDALVKFLELFEKYQCNIRFCSIRSVDKNASTAMDVFHIADVSTYTKLTETQCIRLRNELVEFLGA